MLLKPHQLEPCGYSYLFSDEHVPQPRSVIGLWDWAAGSVEEVSVYCVDRWIV